MMGQMTAGDTHARTHTHFYVEGFAECTCDFGSLSDLPNGSAHATFVNDSLIGNPQARPVNWQPTDTPGQSGYDWQTSPGQDQ